MGVIKRLAEAACERRGWITLALAIAVLAALPQAAHAGLLSNAGASRHDSSSAAIDLGPVAAVSRSSAGEGSAEWRLVEIAGTNVLGTRSVGHSGEQEWTGTAASLGKTIDDLNRAGCVGDDVIVCVEIADGDAAAHDDGSSGRSTSARGNVLRAAVISPEASAGAVAGHSSASTSNRDLCREDPDLEYSNASRAAPVAYEVITASKYAADLVDPSEAEATDRFFC